MDSADLDALLDRSLSESAVDAACPGLADVGIRARPPQTRAYRRVKFNSYVAALVLADFVGSVYLGILTFRLYENRLDVGQDQLWLAVVGFLVAWCLCSTFQDLYRRISMVSAFRGLLVRTAATWSLTFGLMLLIGSSFRMSGVSHIWLLTWAAAVLAWILISRFAWRACLRDQINRGSCVDCALVLAGSERSAHDFSDKVETESCGNIRVAACASLPGTFGGPPLEWVEELVGGAVVDRVIVAHFEQAMQQTNLLLARLARVAVDVTLIPNLESLRAPVLRMNHIGVLPGIDLDSRPLTPMQAGIKRAEDMLLASVLLVLLAPLLLLISISIRLDSKGPIFFRQQRAGLHGRTFFVWKFRSMRHQACGEPSLLQTSRHDDRVTRVGGFLRRTSLDELPQLFNVFKGTMSIVGPRPHAVGMKAVGRPLTEVLDEYSARHRLKPGITGWAQVNGCRGEVDSEEKLRRRVALDCYYIENWSLTFDAWIILRTAAFVLFDENAY